MPAAIKGKDRGAPSDFVEKAKAKVKKKREESGRVRRVPELKCLLFLTPPAPSLEIGGVGEKSKGKASAGERSWEATLLRSQSGCRIIYGGRLRLENEFAP